MRSAEHMIPEYKLFVRYYEMQAVSFDVHTDIYVYMEWMCYSHIIYNSIKKFISLSTVDEYEMIHLLTAYMELIGTWHSLETK